MFLPKRGRWRKNRISTRSEKGLVGRHRKNRRSTRIEKGFVRRRKNRRLKGMRRRIVEERKDEGRIVKEIYVFG